MQVVSLRFQTRPRRTARTVDPHRFPIDTLVEGQLELVLAVGAQRLHQ